MTILDFLTSRRKFLNTLGVMAAAIVLKPSLLAVTGKTPDDILAKKIAVTVDDMGGQRGYVCWKSYHASVVFNDRRLARIDG